MKFITVALISVHALAAAPVADGVEERSLLRGFNSELIETQEPLNPTNCPMASQAQLKMNPCKRGGRGKPHQRQTICCTDLTVWVQCWETCYTNMETKEAADVIEES